MSHTKRHLEQEVERRCTCGEGCSFDPADHEEGCEAVKYIKENLP